MNPQPENSGTPPVPPEPPAAGAEPPAPGAVPPPPGQVPPAPGTSTAPGFFNWIRQQGLHRGRDRWLGGVASGIAERLGIDPLIVRGIFVVLALFAGLGVLAYGIAWALLPEPDGRIHVEEVGRGHWSAGMTGATVMTVLGLSGGGRGMFGGAWGNGWFPWPLLWVAVVVGLVYLLANRGHARRQPGVPPGAQAPTAAYPPAAPPLPVSAPPLVSARPPYRATRPATALAALSAGLALVAGGVVLTLDAAGVLMLGTHAAAVAWAAGAIVLGAGIVVAGALGRSSGILSFLAVCALVGAAVSGVAGSADRLAVGRTENWAPSSVAALADGYHAAASRGEVDLRAIASAAPLPADVTVPITAAMSTVDVRIPANLPVRVSSHLAFGTVHVNGASGSSGIWNPGEQVFNATAPGHTLTLDLQGAFSTMTIFEP